MVLLRSCTYILYIGKHHCKQNMLGANGLSICKSGSHRPDVPVAKVQDSCCWFIWPVFLLGFGRCIDISTLVRFVLAPSTQGSRCAAKEQHLIGWGLPSLRRAVAVHWGAMNPPTDRSDPWRLAEWAVGLEVVTEDPLDDHMGFSQRTAWAGFWRSNCCPGGTNASFFLYLKLTKLCFVD